MAEFLTGARLSEAVDKIIWEAEKQLLIVSPFIKLDDHFKKLFGRHLNNNKLHILILFGKNEGTIRKSLRKSDFDYFKQFMNVSVVYAPNLHGKYYGNEKEGIITSINLYDYSFTNNIEFGVYSRQSAFYHDSSDKDAWQSCWEIAEQNEAIFIKRPLYDISVFNNIQDKRYVKSDVLYDVTEKFYSSFPDKSEYNAKKISDFPEELELGSISASRPVRNQTDKVISNSKPSGFCIRTGKPIPFNSNRPFSEDSYKTWAAFCNWDFPEAYCHKTGKPSYGKTSMRNPILYWK